mgnify:CR=1 FL=1
MHMQGTPETMQNDPSYDDVVTEILSFLQKRAEECIKAGIDKNDIIIIKLVRTALTLLILPWQ